MGRASVRLGLLQHGCGLDPRQNLETALALARQAAAGGAKIIVTQELFVSRYFPQVESEAAFTLAESVPGPTSARLSSLCKELGVYLSASLFEKRAAGVFHNTSVLIDPGGAIVGKYRKMHIPDDPRFFEKYYFTPGDLGFPVQHTPLADTAMLICWDQWFPEAARLASLAGAQILFYPTAIAWHQGESEDNRQKQLQAWITIQRAHAISNGVFVAAVNRVGHEDDLHFWGHSFVADPSGTIIAQAQGAADQVLLADCDLALIEKQRLGWPFLRDRRIDAYQGLNQRLLDQGGPG